VVQHFTFPRSNSSLYASRSSAAPLPWGAVPKFPDEPPPPPSGRLSQVGTETRANFFHAPRAQTTHLCWAAPASGTPPATSAATARGAAAAPAPTLCRRRPTRAAARAAPRAAAASCAGAARHGGAACATRPPRQDCASAAAPRAPTGCCPSGAGARGDRLAAPRSRCCLWSVSRTARWRHCSLWKTGRHSAVFLRAVRSRHWCAHDPAPRQVRHDRVWAVSPQVQSTRRLCRPCGDCGGGGACACATVCGSVPAGDVFQCWPTLCWSPKRQIRCFDQ